MSTESSGKPDAWKLARPVWGWGRGEIPVPFRQACKIFSGGAAMTGAGPAGDHRAVVGAAAVLPSVCR